MTIGLTGYTPTWMMFSDEGSGSEPIDVDAILNDPRWSRIADEEETRELHPDLASPWPSFVVDRVKRPPPRRRGRPRRPGTKTLRWTFPTGTPPPATPEIENQAAAGGTRPPVQPSPAPRT